MNFFLCGSITKARAYGKEWPWRAQNKIFFFLISNSSIIRACPVLFLHAMHKSKIVFTVESGFPIFFPSRAVQHGVSKEVVDGRRPPTLRVDTPKTAV